MSNQTDSVLVQFDPDNPPALVEDVRYAADMLMSSAGEVSELVTSSPLDLNELEMAVGAVESMWAELEYAAPEFLDAAKAAPGLSVTTESSAA